MPITTAKDAFIALLSDVRQGAERGQRIYEELGQAAEDPEIKEALDARNFVSKQILTRLDECFRLIGEKPLKTVSRLQEVFLEDFRRELVEIKSPLARRIFVLARASRLMHLRIGEYTALIAASDIIGHPAVGMLLESCLADKLAFVERTKRLIRERLAERFAA
jgi:ferritin-like metal-binding protein YciE